MLIVSQNKCFIVEANNISLINQAIVYGNLKDGGTILGKYKTYEDVKNVMCNIINGCMIGERIYMLPQEEDEIRRIPLTC